LNGWALEEATSISADGTVIVGVGTNPSGARQGWRVIYHRKPVLGLFVDLDNPGAVPPLALESVSPPIAKEIRTFEGTDLIFSMRPISDGLQTQAGVFPLLPGGVGGTVPAGIGESRDAYLRSGSGDDITPTAPLQAAALFSSNESRVSQFIVSLNDDSTPEPSEGFRIPFSLPSALNPSGGTLTAPGLTLQYIIDASDGGVDGQQLFVDAVQPVRSAQPLGTPLVVNSQGAPEGAAWRLFGENVWREFGTGVSGLLPGEYTFEFRPINGRVPQPVTVTVPATGTVPPLSVTYPATASTATGSVSITISPASVANANSPDERGQWRRFGDGDGDWMDSGAVIPGVSEGLLLLEFKPVPGRITPQSISLFVSANSLATQAVGYGLPTVFSPDNEFPSPIDLDDVLEEQPYVYCGQLISDTVRGSGVGIKRRVVLTAASVVFDDAAQAYVTGLRWHLGRIAGALEPAPLASRGMYVLSGYADARRGELDGGADPGSIGALSAVDAVAAVYFLKDCARGGASGHIETNAVNKPLESTPSIRIVGYPTEAFPGFDPSVSGERMQEISINGAAQGDPATRLAVVAGLGAPRGMEGSPVLVPNENGDLVPAGVYIGTNAGLQLCALDEMVRTAIDAADVSSRGGPNNVAGGIPQVNSELSKSTTTLGSLTVTLTGGGLTSGQGGWRIAGEQGFRQSGSSATLRVGSYVVEFASAGTLVKPANRTVQVQAGQAATITGTYSTARRPVFATGTLPVGVSAQPYSTRIVVTGNPTSLTASIVGLDPTTGAPDTSGLFQPGDPGLNLVGNELAGVPTRAGNYRVTLRAGNSLGVTETELMLQVVDAVSLRVDYDQSSGTVRGDLRFSPTRRLKQPPLISPSGGGDLVPGRRYTLFATPAAGFVFAGWRTVVAGVDGPVFSTASPLDYLAQQPTTLRAVFNPDPFPALVGGFCGLVGVPSPQLAADRAGLLNVQLALRGLFTGTVQLGGLLHPFQGRFDGAGGATVTIPRRGRPPLTIQMQLDVSGVTEKIAGTLAIGQTAVVPIEAERTVSVSLPDFQLKSYTGVLVSSATGGPGYTTLAVDRRGGVRLVGALGDLTPLNYGAKITAASRIPVYVPLSAGAGYVHGYLEFADNPGVSDFTGTLTWKRPANSRAIAYPDPINDSIAATGALLQRFPLPYTGGTFTAVSAPGVLPALFETPLTVNPTRGLFTATGTPSFSLTLVPGTGLIRGTFTDGTSKRRMYTGVLFGATNSARGQFLFDNKTTGNFQIATTP
jgi:hypothetical protein